ncbi:SdpI family protein [Microbacterium amylolyticum]|uniref:Membrane protein n=1 Tax=Microbacterium amylolyticum TaxID=936337 RepID=A0ABS4ZJM0_9MICO|nr:SdpI family protein [Microbacterium amylolyticum]MBP2437488.1 putative membrane protein [Microbacterium amylolyticum]
MMDSDLAPKIVFFVCMVGSGVLLIWMAQAAASGRLKRNPLAGIRTSRTMESDAAWLAAHIRARRPTAMGGITAVVAGCCVLLPVPVAVFSVIVLAGAVATLAIVIYAAVVGGRAAAEASSGEKQEDLV